MCVCLHVRDFPQSSLTCSWAAVAVQIDIQREAQAKGLYLTVWCLHQPLVMHVDFQSNITMIASAMTSIIVIVDSTMVIYLMMNMW